MWPVMLSIFALLIALYELFVCYRKPACFTVAALPILRSVQTFGAYLLFLVRDISASAELASVGSLVES